MKKIIVLIGAVVVLGLGYKFYLSPWLMATRNSTAACQSCHIQK